MSSGLYAQTPAVPFCERVVMAAVRMVDDRHDLERLVDPRSELQTGGLVRVRGVTDRGQRAHRDDDARAWKEGQPWLGGHG